MDSKKLCLRTALAVSGLLATGICSAQDLPMAPVPIVQQAPAANAPRPGESPVATGSTITPVAPAPPVPVGPQSAPYFPAQPSPMPPPPPPQGYFVNPYPDTIGAPAGGEPFFEQTPVKPRGLFAGIEADVVWPHIKNRLSAPVTIDGFTDELHLTTQGLEGTGSPLFILGYRFAPGYGEFTASYRSLVTEGTRNIEGFDFMGEGFLKSRLNVNVVDLDYGSQDIPLVSAAPGQLWDLKFDVGARLAGVYFDSTASGFALGQHVSNNFFGAGPHVSLELCRYFPECPGFALYGKVDTAVVIGRIHQNFNESFTPDGVFFVSGTTSQSGTQSVPMLGIEAGLSWTPVHTLRWLRFTGGYTFEQWWDVGTIHGSSADLTYQGLFLRTELHF